MKLLASIGIVVPFLLLTVIFLIWWERKLLADIQQRIGPKHHGPFGLFQLAFDGMKLVAKEDIIPGHADKLLFIVAPFIVFVPALMTYIAIPIYKNLIVRDFDIGIFYIFAAATLIPVGMILAGWSSYNKYSMLGALRAAAQQISYEVPLMLATLGAIICAGSLSLVKIVEAQTNVWFIVLQPFGFIFFFIIMLAELNRAPFDMPEAESELVAGYYTEYTGMRFAFMLFGEYAMIFTMSAVVTLLFLGGWNSPVAFLQISILEGVYPGIAWFFAKTYLIIFILIWIRGTLPRVRVDQLMSFSWKILLPLNLVNLLVTAGIVALPLAKLW